MYAMRLHGPTVCVPSLMRNGTTVLHNRIATLNVFFKHHAVLIWLMTQLALSTLLLRSSKSCNAIA